MAKIKAIFTRQANTLDIWFDDPEKEAYCSETGEDIVLKKDKAGKVIGLEIFNFLAKKKMRPRLSKVPVDVSVY